MGIGEEKMITLKSLGGIIGDFLVNHSLIPPATRRVHPTARKEMVSAEDPAGRECQYFVLGCGLTTRLCFIEPKEHENDARHDQE